MDFILASKSPRRIDLLSEAGYKFEVIPSQSEEITKNKRPSAMVKDLSCKKAFEVASKYPAQTVVGADTLVFCKGRVIGKPKDEKDALRILKFLNGSWQSVYTGVSIINVSKKKIFTFYDVTKCRARALPLEELKKMSSKHLDKAGAYAMQDTDDRLIERIVGSRSNVVGMPVEMFNKVFKDFKK
ncbi:septum formation protein [Parelusimicrobium proximum]|uniref:Maf family protein n=1 Tax=Parelusimicrobium proximum TaxID=3228953 RepID=UPI003D16D141